ncbi:MAG: penicillin-binding transpeptidase domain-containing protein [Planctomycetota bacterium]
MRRAGGGGFGTGARIRWLGLALALPGLVIAAHLALLMVGQHAAWLERSYRNRWVFKDVPARRGALLDRDGVLLADDQPAFALSLHFREFRRGDPVGVAVHGANLAAKAEGLTDNRYRLVRGAHGPRAAFARMMALPWAWLQRQGIPAELSRDLRFYAAALLGGLLEIGRSRGFQRLDAPPVAGAAAAPGAPLTLADALGADDVAALRAAFAERLIELERLDVAVRGAGARRGLWQVLEQQRQRLWLQPEAEDVLFTLARRLEYDVAVRVALQAERHPGLTLQPTVQRYFGRVPGRDDLASLQAFVGIVRPFWREDREAIDEQVEAVLEGPVLAGLVPRNPDLPDTFQQRLARVARQRVSLHYQLQGRMGKGGLERAFDGWLAGDPGLRLVEKDRRAQERGLWSALQVSPGRPLRTTFDLELQRHLEDALDANPCGTHMAAALIDPRTGEIRALGWRPLPAPGETMWRTPATHWPKSGMIGSVAKPFVLLEQLDAMRRGRPHQAPIEFRECGGKRSYPVRGLTRPLGCSGTHGALATDPVMALAKSCNVFYYQAAAGLGEGALRRAFARAGWTPDAPTEQTSLTGMSLARCTYTTATLREQRAIGYGTQANVLHVARAYAALATGALPRLRVVAADGAAPQRLDVHPDDLAAARAGMRACVNGGTARNVVGLAELLVLAKTGTAEISTKTRANNAWFAGYLTEARPTLAFAAVAYSVPDGQHGAEAAGHLIADVLRAVQRDPTLRERYVPGVGGE